MKKITITGQTLNQLYVSEVEKDVENSYRQFLSTKIPDMIFTSPYLCDGYGVSKKHKIRILCEFKKDFDFRKKSDRVIALCQVIVYIKKFVLDGTKIPNIVLVGDKNEWFVLHVNELFKYLDLDIDWSISPSSAHTNKVLFDSLMNDNEINPFVFDVTQIDEIVTKIKNLAKNVVRLIPITPKNMVDVFTHFVENVLGNNNLKPNELANLFIQILINQDDNFLHKRKKTIYTKAFGEVPVKSNEDFDSFFKHFEYEYSPKQKELLTGSVDRLVEEFTRAKQGEFFTKTEWVDIAHKYTEDIFGKNWKEENIVWDMAWGTGNLTRDYDFKNLFVSTLNYSDIETANQMGFNKNSEKFQYDFVNDDYDFLPKKLKEHIESGEDILININPPYASASSFGTKDKKNAAKTQQNKLMVKNGLGKSAQNLYAQFIYRIIELQKVNKNIKLCIFCPSLFLTGSSFKQLRKLFFEHFVFEKGFLFDATHFSDVAKGWGINYLCFSPRKKDSVDREIIVDLLDIEKDNIETEIFNLGQKKLYNLDNKVLSSDWVREEIKKIKTDSSLPQMKNSLEIYYGEDRRGSYIENSLGYFLNGSNCVDKNTQQVGLWSVGFYNGNGLSITEDNFKKCMSLFSARKIIQKNWINSKDEYSKPDVENELYTNFVNDSIIYSLFNSSSHQNSLRQINFDNKFWDIKNNFFWLSKEDVVKLADSNNYDEIYRDSRTDKNRFVHNLLFGEENLYSQLSQEAKLVLDKATELFKISFSVRKDFANNLNQLNSWDAGYAQLKLLWKEYFPEEFKEFRQLYKNLEDRMRPLVYELGFLLK